MPQTSATGIEANIGLRLLMGMALKLHTPEYSGRFLAQWLASLAKIFVLAMPTHTGIPAHCKTVAFISLP